MTANLFGFATVIAIAAISPGPNIVLTVEHAARIGVRRIFPTILGNIACLLIIAFAAVLGIGTVLEGEPHLFLALQLGGAVYLGFIGLQSLRAAHAAVVPNGSIRDSDVAPNSRGNLAAHDRFRQAFLISATNPKSVLFLASVFPNFIDPAEALPGQLASLFVALTLVVSAVHFGYALMAQRIYHLVGHVRLKRNLKFVSGVAFLSFALIIIGATIKR